MSPRPIIEFIDIHKTYPDGVKALEGVSLEIYRGEIHGLLGENGAGKTTLMRILYGEIRPTRGRIKIYGRDVNLRGPWDAIRMGIGMVYQHYTLIDSFTVLENLYLSLSSIGFRGSISEIRGMAEGLMDRIGLKVDLDAYIEDLPVGIQQRVEILKTLLMDAKIIILDEPTSVLTPIEVKELFKTLRRLRGMGITIIFITHKLREALELCDRITVLRRGRIVDTVASGDIDEGGLARMMVGREIFLKVSKRPRERGRLALRVVDLWVEDDRGIDRVKGLNIELYEGEILGIAGVEGNGQSELLEAIAGLRPVKRGRIIMYGRDITGLKTIDRYKMGLAYIPGSRSTGLIYDMNLIDNSILTHLYGFTIRHVVDWGRAGKYAEDIINKFNVSTPSIRSNVRYLSGGNQQRLLLGREVLKEPSIIILAEPTHGLDVSATEYVWRLLMGLRDRGKAIMLVSSELDEIIELSDRIGVIYDGRIVSIDEAGRYDLDRLGMLMGGAIGEA